MLDILNLFDNVRVYKKRDHYFLHKPFLILLALGLCYKKNPRLISYTFIDNKLSSLFEKFYPEGLVHNNTFYPFGKLENDKIWEVENSSLLGRTSAGHLIKSELIKKNIHGGFTLDIYDKLIEDRKLIKKISLIFLKKYFPTTVHSQILEFVGINSEPMTLYQSDTETPLTLQGKEYMQSGYISYLNSLHNVNASNTNALAESQALHPHFADLYEAFSVTKPLTDLLTTSEDLVVILTGHAGDGKSTIALDILKRLRGLAPHAILDKPLEGKEVCFLPNKHPVHIVKDMSELEKEKRREWLDQAFNKAGSWLIVSNTGPMLTSLTDFFSDVTPRDASVENAVLKALDDTFLGRDFDNLTINEMGGYQLPKPLIIINVAQLDNTELGAKLLKKMIYHPGWDECNACPSKPTCPLRKNRDALIESPEIIDRVRWVYQRLTAYDQRLTLRQMVGHLALSLTGNMNCRKAQSFTRSKKLEQGLAEILFSETFFGYKAGKKSNLITGVKAAELLQRMELGGNIAVDFERQLIRNTEQRSYALPSSLEELNLHWVDKAQGKEKGIHLRYALRRMVYIFGLPSPIRGCEPRFDTFLNQFLQSARLRDLDNWNKGAWATLRPPEKKTLIKNILSVLLEVYSGFKSSQFSEQTSLYLTMRRTNSDVSQISQLVIATEPHDNFSISLDSRTKLPILSHKNNQKTFLTLNLPLLDFIQARNSGSLGTSLSPIHLANLEVFRAKILNNSENKEEVISILKVGIKGEVELKKYYFDKESKTLESGL